MAIVLITNGNMGPNDVWVGGWGLTGAAKEQEMKDRTKGQTNRREKKVNGLGKGQLDGGTDKEESWTKYSQTALVCFSTCSRASHSAIVDWQKTDNTEQTVRTWNCSLGSFGMKQPLQAIWNALKTKGIRHLTFGNLWNKVRAKDTWALLSILKLNL